MQFKLFHMDSMRARDLLRRNRPRTSILQYRITSEKGELPGGRDVLCRPESFPHDTVRSWQEHGLSFS